METESSTLNATELSRAINAHTAQCQSHLEEVQRTAVQVRDNAAPYVRETAPDFEARQARFIAARDRAELLATHALGEARIAAQKLEATLSGSTGLGLSTAEWQAAGQLAALVSTRIQNAPLSVAIGDLRGALAAGDRPRMAAVLSAAEARLAHPEPAPADGRVPIRQTEHRSELATLVSEAKDALRDRTLDPARARLTALHAARGELGALVDRHRAQRELAAQLASGERVAIPRAS